MAETTDVELKPEASGGGNRTRPPITVITGDHPEDRHDPLRRELDRYARLLREMDAMIRESEQRNRQFALDMATAIRDVTESGRM